MLIAISERIKNLTSIDELQVIRKTIQELSSSFANENAQFLANAPSYDQRYYTESLDKLIEAVETAKSGISGTRKFSFKNRKTVPLKALISATDNVNTEIPTSTTSKEPYKKDIINQVLVIPESCPRTLFIDKVENSTILLDPKTKLYSVHLSSLKNSTVIISSETSIFIEDLTNCKLVTRSLQLRLHNISETTVIPQIMNEANRIIIEDCKSLRIGRTEKEKQFVEVDDFKAPNKTKKNDNYQFISDDDLVYNDIKKIDDGKNNATVN